MQFAICNFLFLACLLFTSTPAEACNVPVFRYALERWAGDPFEVLVFHRGPLAAEGQAVVDALEQPAGDRGVSSRFALNLVDLDQSPDAELLKVYESRGAGFQPATNGKVKNLPHDLPFAIVRHPVASRIETVVWSGKLADLPVAKLVDSPVRREIAKRILAGETAVWVLLESGRKEQDDAAATLLQAELEKLPQSLKLPELTDEPEDKLAGGGPPLRIAFSFVRLSRKDAAEELFVRMLLDAEDDLQDRTDTMVFPIFGRGRALFPLIGAGITAENIGETAAFLVGPCSCIVKRLNPGIDLLFTAGWGALHEDDNAGGSLRDPQARSQSDRVPLVPLPRPAAVPTAAVNGMSVDVVDISVSAPPRNLILAGIVIAGLLVIATGAWVVRSQITLASRGRQPPGSASAAGLFDEPRHPGADAPGSP